MTHNVALERLALGAVIVTFWLGRIRETASEKRRFGMLRCRLGLSYS